MRVNYNGSMVCWRVVRAAVSAFLAALLLFAGVSSAPQRLLCFSSRRPQLIAVWHRRFAALTHRTSASKMAWFNTVRASASSAKRQRVSTFCASNGGSWFCVIFNQAHRQRARSRRARDLLLRCVPAWRIRFCATRSISGVNAHAAPPGASAFTLAFLLCVRVLRAFVPASAGGAGILVRSVSLCALARRAAPSAGASHQRRYLSLPAATPRSRRVTRCLSHARHTLRDATSSCCVRRHQRGWRYQASALRFHSVSRTGGRVERRPASIRAGGRSRRRRRETRIAGIFSRTQTRILTRRTYAHFRAGVRVCAPVRRAHGTGWHALAGHARAGLSGFILHGLQHWIA